MNTTSHPAKVLRSTLENPTRGVVGLVDDLLAVCREHGLQLDWQADRCRVRSNGGDWEEVKDIPLRKSVFRAILARLAALCNEQSPNAVSPYGGQGELLANANSPAVFRITFSNTPAEQKLELTTEPYQPGRCRSIAGQVESIECSPDAPTPSMIANRTEYQKAQEELRALEERLEQLQQNHPLGSKGFTKAGLRKMIARLHEELAVYEGSEEARQSDSSN